MSRTREGRHPPGVLRPHSEHVHDDIGLEAPQLVETVLEDGEVAVEVLRGHVRLVLTAMEDGELVTGGGELAHGRRPDELRPSKEEDLHDAGPLNLGYRPRTS